VEAKITAISCRMARSGLGIGIRDVAELSGLAVNTVQRFERGAELKVRTVLAIQSAYEARGCTFLADDGNGPGVRVRPLGETSGELMQAAD